MKIKYMGTSDNRVLEKGEDFGGQLAEPLAKTVAWTPQNNHLVDSDEAGLSEAAVALILELEGAVYGEGGLVDEAQDTGKTVREFKDVSDLKVIPPSLHQSTYLGLKGIKNKAVTGDDDDPEPDEDTSGSKPETAGERKTRKAAASQSNAGGTATGGTTAAVGGSTDGVGGDGTAGGGGTTTVGGSTGGNS